MLLKLHQLQQNHQLRSMESMALMPVHWYVCILEVVELVPGEGLIWYRVDHNRIEAHVQGNRRTTMANKFLWLVYGRRQILSIRSNSQSNRESRTSFQKRLQVSHHPWCTIPDTKRSKSNRLGARETHWRCRQRNNQEFLGDACCKQQTGCARGCVWEVWTVDGCSSRRDWACGY